MRKLLWIVHTETEKCHANQDFRTMPFCTHDRKQDRNDVGYTWREIAGISFKNTCKIMKSHTCGN